MITWLSSKRVGLQPEHLRPAQWSDASQGAAHEVVCADDLQAKAPPTWLSLFPAAVPYILSLPPPSSHRRLSHRRLATPVRARVPVGEAVRPCRSGILAPRRRANLIRIYYILDRKAVLVLVPFLGTTNAPAWARVVAATLLGETTTGPKNGPGLGVGKWTCFWVRKTDQG